MTDPIDELLASLAQEQPPQDLVQRIQRRLHTARRMQSLQAAAIRALHLMAVFLGLSLAGREFEALAAFIPSLLLDHISDWLILAVRSPAQAWLDLVQAGSEWWGAWPSLISPIVILAGLLLALPAVRLMINLLDLERTQEGVQV